MTVLEAISLFKHEMINEILNANMDSTLKDMLLESVDSVANTVTQTFYAEKKTK